MTDATRLGVRWRAFPNPMRSDGVFILEDKDPAPNRDGLRHVDGTPVMDLPPGVGFWTQVTPELGEHVVRLHNEWLEENGDES